MTYSKQALHYITKYQQQDPNLTTEQAYDKYIAMMRERGGKGGKAPVGGFNIPGVAKRAAYRSAEVKRAKKNVNS